MRTSATAGQNLQASGCWSVRGRPSAEAPEGVDEYLVISMRKERSTLVLHALEDLRPVTELDFITGAPTVCVAQLLGKTVTIQVTSTLIRVLDPGASPLSSR